ncbi:MAG TPA: Rieske 2Fe-2S domain-containing protein, partial [Dehalococcoidia bacterium]|nr:Rieske 2Fe-2S domain-containing protein [Dehalococcoidia bacterium]
PALLSSELPTPDSPPVRVRLLGEDLVAFRDTNGSVGLFVQSCPHRGASLFFGRNEEEGLRCVYHGWKFDTAGACVDMPSEPAESNFRAKVHARTYAATERNGVIWVYMGPRETPPPLPEFEANLVPEAGVTFSKVLRECNWMQALEGDIDTSHLGFLHFGASKPEDAVEGSFDYYVRKDRAPRYDVIDTPVGTSYGAYRPAEADTMYWRIAHFLFPCFDMIPTGDLGVQVLVRAWVPLDDENTMFWGINVTKSMAVGQGGPGSETRTPAAIRVGTSAADRGTLEFLPPSSGWLGKSRISQTAANDYGIDREAQSSGQSFTGIPGIFQQDQAITESMGKVYDRTHEHLGTSDAMVIRTRRRLLNAAKALRDEAVTPPAVDEPALYRVRSGGIILPRGTDWLEATQDLQHPTVEVAAPATGARASGT